MRSLLHAKCSIAHLGGRWLALGMNKVARALACVIDNPRRPTCSSRLQ